jgi:ribonuclease BN (tRNA processing enzyme)
MSRFGKTTQHVFVGQDCCGSMSPLSSSFMSSCVYNSKLSTLFGNSFQYLLPPNSVASQSSVQTQSNSQFVFGQNLMKYYLLPVKRQGIEYPSDPILPQYDELNLFIEETTKSYLYLTDFNERKALIHQQWIKEKNEDYQVICLGTGCAIPSKYRNVSSLLVLISSTNNGVLLDCGEGTWYQLMHINPLPIPPPSTTTLASIELLKNHPEYKGIIWTSIIKLVWISHPHADHHLGLVNVILQRKKHFQLLSTLSTAVDSSFFSPLIVVAPMIVFSFLKDASSIYPGLESWFYFIPSNYFDPSENCSACAPSALPFPSFLSLIPSFPTSSQTIAFQDVPGMERKEYYRELVGGVIGESSTAVDDKIINETAALDEKVKKRPKLMKLSYSDYFEKNMETQKDFIQQQLTEIGILTFCNIPVIHCKQSYGLIFTITPASALTEEEIKIVYSGDTRPCDLLAYYGKDASLLIHEATFEDDKVIEAINKKHSTINEACEIGRLMNCKAILLTHFSQRYHGVPLQFHPKGQNPVEIVDQLLTQKINESNPDSGETKSLVPIIAFDFMRFSNKDIKWLPYLTYMLAEIFAKDAIEEEKLIE